MSYVVDSSYYETAVKILSILFAFANHSYKIINGVGLSVVIRLLKALTYASCRDKSDSGPD